MPTSGIVVANTFNSESGFVPVSQLDANFAQCITALNTLQSFGNYYVDSGSANAMSVTVPSPLIAAYTAGLPLQVKAAAGNTGATTINVSGLGTRNVTYPNASALLSGQLVTGGIVSLMYDGTNFQYLGPIFGSGTFTCTWGGFSAPPSTTIAWYRSGTWITIHLDNVSGTSNDTSFTMSGIPTYAQSPVTTQLLIIPATDNSSTLTTLCQVQVSPGGSMAFFSTPAGGAWTNVNGKGISGHVGISFVGS